MTNLTLTDYGTLTTIASLPLTILLWAFTRDHFAKFWAKGLKLILLILVAGAVFGLWRFGWLDWVAKDIRLKVWLAVLISLALIAVPFLSAWTWFRLRREFRALDWHNYTKDEILGVVWEWRYRGNQTMQNTLSAFCPRTDCSCRLDFQEHRGFHGEVKTVLRCPHCGFSRPYDEMDERELLRRVELEIERRIKTDAFKNVLFAQDKDKYERPKN
ncbi:MAG TPA: hypothetical protein VN673_04065 [Clostridia bacterium]|nr:hypothetical protein [Clostridia bacterium]